MTVRLSSVKLLGLLLLHQSLTQTQPFTVPKASLSPYDCQVVFSSNPLYSFETLSRFSVSEPGVVIVRSRVGSVCSFCLLSQERRAQESEGDTKTTDLSAIRQKGREKIKQVEVLVKTNFTICCSSFLTLCNIS